MKRSQMTQGMIFVSGIMSLDKYKEILSQYLTEQHGQEGDWLVFAHRELILREYDSEHFPSPIDTAHMVLQAAGLPF